MSEPLVVVVSGPGGVGKGTVVSLLVEQYDDLWLSRSWTTREQREGEADDAYVFVTRDQFEARIEAGGFVEWAEFIGNYYGTPTPDAPPGKDLIYEIEVQGARQVKAIDPDAVLIFLHAPSADEQEARLRGRGDPEEKIQQRIDKAREEITMGRELGAIEIVNDDLQTTVEQIRQVIVDARG